MNTTKEEIKILRESIKGITEKLKKRETNSISEEIRKSVLLSLKPLIQNSETMVGIIEELEEDSNLKKEKMIEVFIDAVKEGFKEIKFEPKIIVPEIKVPKIESPKVRVFSTPQITVKSPEVSVPKFEMPKEMKMTGFGGFIKAVIGTLKGRLDVKLGNVSEKAPLPVTLYLGGVPYVLGGGGGPSRVWLKDKNNQTITPMSEGHTTIGVGAQTATPVGTAIQLSSVSVPCRRVWIQAHQSNGDLTNGEIVIGDANVIATLSTRKGKVLYATQGDWFYPNNLNLLYIIALDGDAKVHYYYEN